MAAAGHEFERPGDGRAEVSRRLGHVVALLDSDEGAARRAYAELAEFELLVAGDDLECIIGEVYAFQREIEQQYLDGAFGNR